MGIGQVTLFANSPVPKGMLVEKIPNPHQILVLSQQRILQTFQAHLQTMESYFLNASSPKSPVASTVIKSVAAPSKAPSLSLL